MRVHFVAALVVVLAASTFTGAATVSVGFNGVVDINGAFPPLPDPVGQPVNGSVRFDSSTFASSSAPTSSAYADPAGVLKMDFGAGGSFTSFTSNTPLTMSVSDSGANTTFRVEGWNGGSPGVGDKGVILFSVSGLNAFGPNHSLPDSPLDFGSLVSGNGGITIGGGLTSFVVQSVSPEPTGLCSLGAMVLLRSRRRV